MRRILVSVPILVIATFVVFAMVSLSGDPLSELRKRNPPPPPRTLELEAQRLHLDEPLLARYWRWITGVIRWRLRYSSRADVRTGAGGGVALRCTCLREGGG